MLAAGLLKLGTLLRFVPDAGMVGFVNAVAVLIILRQLSDLNSYRTGGDIRGPTPRSFSLRQSQVVGFVHFC